MSSDVASHAVSTVVSAERQTMSEVLWQATEPQGAAPGSLVESVYKTLWQQIVEGERQQGERFIELELVKELGVSRTPIRQALFQLQQAGFVQIGENRGFHVVIFGAEDIRELYELRGVLESAAIRAATPQIPEALLRHALEEVGNLERMEEPHLSPAFLHSDIDLHHSLIADHCGNRRLREAIATLRAQMGLFIVGGTRVPGGTSQALEEHKLILEALLARDPKAADDAMTAHIERVKTLALDAFATTRPPRLRRFQPITRPT